MFDRRAVILTPYLVHRIIFSPQCCNQCTSERLFVWLVVYKWKGISQKKRWIVFAQMVSFTQTLTHTRKIPHVSGTMSRERKSIIREHNCVWFVLIKVKLMAAITNGTPLMICQFVSADLFVTLFCNESVRRELMAFFIRQFVDKV